MRSTWRLPDSQVPARDWHERDVILDYNGPQLVLLESDGELFLSVASDADDSFTRWLRAPVTDHEYRQLLNAEKTVLECIRKPSILVVDTDEAGNTAAEYCVLIESLNEDDLPRAGAFLPNEIVESRRLTDDFPRIAISRDRPL